MVGTHCKDCIFAHMDITKKSPNKQIQTSCWLGRIDKYKDQGCITEEVSAEYPYYIINNRICTAWRNEQWRVSQDQPHVLRAKDIVLHDIRWQYALIMIVQPHTTYFDLQKSIETINAFEHRPIEIILAGTNDTFDEIGVVNILKIAKNIQIYQILDDTLIQTPKLIRAVSIIHPHYNYCIIENDFQITNSFFEKIDNKITYDLMQILLIKPIDHINGMVVSKTIIQTLGTADYNELERLINEAAPNNNFIYEAKEFCESNYIS